MMCPCWAIVERQGFDVCPECTSISGSVESQHEKMYLMTCVPSEESDQPMHPHILIRVHHNYAVAIIQWITSCHNIYLPITDHIIHSTVNPLYTDTRYNDKTRYNDNLNVTKTPLQGDSLWEILQDYCMKTSSNICFGYMLESPQLGDSNRYPKHMFYEEITIKQGLSYISLRPLMILYNSKFILMATTLGTNAVVITRVHCIQSHSTYVIIILTILWF